VKKLGLCRSSKVKRKEDYGDMRVQQFMKIRIALLLLFSV
jgi:hypothetical protein